MMNKNIRWKLLTSLGVFVLFFGLGVYPLLAQRYHLPLPSWLAARQLKLGLDLCVPIEQLTIAGKAVHSIGGGVLLACLATQITREEVEPLAQGIVAWHRALTPAGDTTCVFRDGAFGDDVAKTNLAAILSQHGLANVRSL